jgi:poly(3-hydroxybutyrate) depolymerase
MYVHRGIESLSRRSKLARLAVLTSGYLRVDHRNYEVVNGMLPARLAIATNPNQELLFAMHRRRLFELCFVGLLVACRAGEAPASASGPDAKSVRRPGGAPASFKVRTFQAADGRTLDYSLFVPTKIKPGEKLPLVLCLHGAGGNTEAAKVLAMPERQSKHPCIVMAPGCDIQTARWVATPFRPGQQRSVLPELLASLDAVMRELPVDAERVYLTGQSMGGVGTWGIIAAHPERFAAAVPVCGTWQPDDALKLARVPVWVFHGEKDPTVPVEGSRRMIAALKTSGASPRYTEYPGVGHNSWSSAYATDELWEWLFAQRRASRDRD